MTDHVIIQARDEAITRLKAGVAAVSNRVYRSDEVFVESIDESQVPCLVVQVGDDADERIAVNGGAEPAILEDINLSLFVHCVVKQDGDAEAAAYGLRSSVETTFLATTDGLTLGGRVQMITRVGATNNREDLERQCYVVSPQFEIKITHLEGSPTSFVY